MGETKREVSTRTFRDESLEQFRSVLASERIQAPTILPDEIIGRILTMVPFPGVFKARCLSKSWRARFSSIREQADDEQKLSAVWVQEQVRERAKDWGTFYPVFLDRAKSTAFSWESKSWVSLPSLGFLPEDFLIGGSRGANKGDQSGLPWDSPHGPYKVIVFSRRGISRSSWSLNVYESKTDAWRVRDVNVSISVMSRSCKSVYLNGTIYFWRADNLFEMIFTLNVENGYEEDISWVKVCDRIELDHNCSDLARSLDSGSASLLVCNAQLVIAIHTDPRGVVILKIDLETQELLEVCRGPPDSLLGPSEERRLEDGVPECHGNCIYFHYSRTVVYNMLQNKWSLSPQFTYSGTNLSDSIALEAGLEPFRTF